MVALTPTDADHAAVVAEAVASARLGGAAPKYTLREVVEQDWIHLMQSQFEPIHIGANIWIVPSWHDAPDPSALVLQLDPGFAFGTGSHSTTRLCMEWLEAHPPVGLRVLDYGCGSGILAMVAKKLGAREVIGIDIDPHAIQAARENTARNDCEVAYYAPDEFASSSHEHAFDVVVANILANPLKLMAPMLASRVRPGGKLMLSGMLTTQVEDVTAIYRSFIELSVWREHECWVSLAGRLLS